MELNKLEEIVISDAKKEALKLINDITKEVNQLIISETNKINQEFDSNIERINSEYSSKRSYIEFTMDSNQKKKVLHLKHTLINELRENLNKNLNELVKKDPFKYLIFTINNSKIDSGEFCVSKDLEQVISSDIFIKCINRLNIKNIHYSGLDNDIESGVSIRKDKVKYIFLLSEITDKFLEENIKIIHEKLFNE